MIYFLSILTITTIIYCCTIMWIITGFLSLKRKNKINTKTNHAHNISVIIPVRNEEKHILTCLTSLKNQCYDKALFEIIIVNDHSTDRTEQLVNDFLCTIDLNIQLISLTDETSKKEALKYGITLADFAIIATTDADCVLPPNWLMNISNNFNKQTDMLLGPVMFKKEKGFLAAFQTLDMLAIQGVEFGTLALNQPILNNAANLSYTKNAYKDVNGFDAFDTPSGDDVFFLEKFKKQGKKIIGCLSHDFIVETEQEKKLSFFLNQRVRWSSKSKHYSDKLLMAFSGLVLLQNSVSLFMYFWILLVEHHTLIFLILLLTKWLIDFILLFLVARFFKRKSELVYFIPVQLMYPFYIFIVWIASVTLRFEWKGRKY